MIHTCLETNVTEQFNGSDSDLLPRKFALKLHGQFDVLKSRKTTDQVEGLENKTQFVKSDASQKTVLSGALDSETTDVNVSL